MNNRQISNDRCAISLGLRARGCSFRYIAAVLRIGPDRARTYVARGERLQRTGKLHSPLPTLVFQ